MGIKKHAAVVSQNMANFIENTHNNPIWMSNDQIANFKLQKDCKSIT